jgi:hypothetical protein
MTKRILALLALSLMMIQPAMAQAADIGMYTRTNNTDITTPTFGATWNGQNSTGGIFYNDLSGNWDQITLPKINAAGLGPPTVSNDNTQGYAIGSQFFDTVGLQTYVCSDASTGAAVWSQFSNITGGGGGISGSISSGQVAVGSGVNAIGGSSAFTYSGTTLTVPSLAMPGSSSGTFTITPAVAAGSVNIIPPTANPLDAQIAIGQGSSALQFKGVTGDISMADTGVTTLATVNITPGVYPNAVVTVNSKGLCTSVTNGGSPGTGTVTSIAETGDGVLFGSITGSPVTSAGTFNLSSSQLNAPASSWFGNATGSPAAWGFITSAIPYALGGTNATSQSAFRVNASPFTTLGDTLYGGASGVPTRLAGNITTSPQFLTQTGNGSISAAPVLTGFSSVLPSITFTLTGGNIQEDVIQANLSLASIGGLLNVSSQVTGVGAIANGMTGASTAAGALTNLGATPIQLPVLIKTGNYTRLIGDYIVEYNCAGGNVFDFIPAASSSTAGIIYRVVKIDGTSNSITVTPPSGLINGASSYTITTPFNGAGFWNDSTNYYLQ